MSTIELKYTLFKDIDSITDEMTLHKLVALVKAMQVVPYSNVGNVDDSEEIPSFIRNMSVKTDLPGSVDVKELMHEHWTAAYG